MSERDQEIENAHWRGKTDERLYQLEKRATSWDAAIDSLTKWQIKMAAYGTVAAAGMAILINVIIELLGA